MSNEKTNKNTATVDGFKSFWFNPETVISYKYNDNGTVTVREKKLIVDGRGSFDIPTEYEMDSDEFRDKLFLSEYHCEYLCNKLTKSAYKAAEQCHLNELKNNGIKVLEHYFPSYRELWIAHETLSKHKIYVKRDSFAMKKFIGENFSVSNGIFYVTDSTKNVEYCQKNNCFDELKVCNISAPVTRVSEACEKLGKEVVLFDVQAALDYFPMVISKGNFGEMVFDTMLNQFTDPVTGAKLSETEKARYKKLSDVEKSVMYCMLNGFTDQATGKTYYVLGASASKIRSGGMFMFVEGLGSEHTWLENWEYIEKTVRPACFGLTYEQYLEEVKNAEDCVLLKFETAHIGMNTSSGLSIEQIAKKIRNEKIVNILNNANVKVVEDVIVKAVSMVLKPDRENPEWADLKKRPLLFKVQQEEIDNNVTDGSSFGSVRYMAALHYGAGDITVKQYGKFLKHMNRCVTIDDFFKDKWLKHFVRDYVTSVQTRYARGIKGMIITCPWIDFDPRCKALNVDILTTGKSVKYIADDVQPQILNNTHPYQPEIKRDRTNYQQLQNNTMPVQVGVEKVKEETEKLMEVFNDVTKLFKFTGNIRSFLKDVGDMASISTLQDLEIEPQLIKEHYHFNFIKDKVIKRLKELGTGKIPCNGQYIHITVDPLYCFHKLVSQLTEEAIKAAPEHEAEFHALQEEDDKFESELESGMVYCNDYKGFCGIWRNPMIHHSEPRRSYGIHVDYLGIYADLCIFNPYDMYAMSLGGADYDGDKCYVVFANMGKFEYALVAGITNTDYIIGEDDSVKAGKRKNHLFERIFAYSQVCMPANVGKITNMATCWTDFYNNIKDIPEKESEAERINNINIRMRYGQGWAIDFPKTGINENGADGTLFPIYILKPKFKPEWLFIKSLWDKNMEIPADGELCSEAFCTKNVFERLIMPDGSKPKIIYEYKEVDKDTNREIPMVCYNALYRGNSLMASICAEIQKVISGITVSQGNVCLNLFEKSLTPQEYKAYEQLRFELMPEERKFANALRDLHTLEKPKPVAGRAKKRVFIQEDESKDYFKSLTEAFEATLMGYVNEKSGATVEAVAAAAYYAANFRKNNSAVTGSRCFPFLAFHEGIMKLLARNNDGMSLYSLPCNIEIESVEVVDGCIYINDKLYAKDRPYQNGIYDITDIEGKPYIFAKTLSKPEDVVIPELPCTNFLFSKFTRYYQGINSEQMAEILENNIFSIEVSQEGSYVLVVNNVPYAEVYGGIHISFVGKPLELIELMPDKPLTFTPQKDLPSTVYKDKDRNIAYSQCLHALVRVVK